MAIALRQARRAGGARLLVDPPMEMAVIDELRERPEVAGVARRQVIIDSFRETIAESIAVTTGFYILFASLCTIGVVYNAARIGLSERGRELASLRVLGFTRAEIAYILLGEMLLLTLVALPLGCLFGIGLALFITTSMANELFRLPYAVAPSSLLFAMTVVLLAAVLAGLLVGRQLWRLDIVSALKTRE
jgi:putative ABC transport system permease protein